MATGLTKSKIEKMAIEVRQLLIDYEAWIDTRIYFNGKAFATDDGNGHYSYNNPERLFIIEDIDPHDYTEYCGEDILVMTFEGPLYDCLNYGGYDSLERELSKIFKKYGCYYELGEAWNLALARM